MNKAQDNCVHDLVINPATFRMFCRKCNYDPFHMDLEATQPLPIITDEAYDRAMKGIKMSGIGHGSIGQGIDSIDSAAEEWYEIGADDFNDDTDIDQQIKELEDMLKGLNEDDQKDQAEEDYDRAMDIVVGKKV